MVPPPSASVSSASYTFTTSTAGGRMNADAPLNGRPGKPPLPHIDDLLNPPVNIDAFAPIETVIAQGENHLRSAESLKGFGRPHMALKEYVSATVVAVEAVPRNKGFGSLSDRKQLAARHTALMRKIQALHPDFEKVKAAVKLDNQKSGVRPQRASSSSTQANGHAQPGLQSNGSAVKPVASQQPLSGNGAVPSPGYSQDAAQHAANGIPTRRPAPHPKPQALHGNSVLTGPNGAGPSSPPVQDLAERFANLRGGKNGAGVPSPRPLGSAGSRPTPGQVAGISVLSDIPADFPKVPEAIYSPARGTVSNESANLPSSNSRGMFSRAASSTSMASQGKQPLGREDYSAPANNEQAKPPPARPQPRIPDGDTVTPEQLFEFMRCSSVNFKVLIIDVRTREEFNEGHIMSTSIICVEPDVLQREHISADDIAQSLILAPPREEEIFSRRSEYDLVVFYNQDSQEINWRGGTPAENALFGLYNALRHFDYDLTGDSKPAKLLKGGLDAWVELVGENALERSETSGAIHKIQHAKSRFSLSRGQGRPKAKPIQNAEDARRWNEKLTTEGQSIVRTQEEFLRRFPAVSDVQESMTAPVTQATRGFPASADINNTMLAPPARPARTRTRQNYTGLMETGEEELYTPVATESRALSRRERRPVGLSNPGVWCYSNASIQALFHSSGFVDELIGEEWQSRWKVPMRDGEKLENHQFLSKILSNLFHWMLNGQFESMECRTLMEYCNFIDRNTATFDNGENLTKGEREAFGSRHKQQDAEEFISFLMDHLHDETNRLRNKNFDPSSLVFGKENHQNALTFWNGWCSANDSVIDRYWRGLSQNVVRCRTCNHTNYSHEAFNKIQVPVPEARGPCKLVDLLPGGFSYNELLDGYKCDGCSRMNTTSSTVRLARLPKLLCISLSRFSVDRGDTRKNNTKVVFPLDDLNLAAVSDPTPSGEGIGEEWTGPFRYYCYAAVLHGGTLRSGHYTAFVRDQNPSRNGGVWYHCNDSIISTKTIRNEEDADAAGMYAADSESSAYILFYSRQPVAK
ncbi:ubiquitin carboxyl-terminal hydrolase 2 [Pyricularia oryzae 70-15]|uniref:Ubiquitin carboxyl-terminal hydrolase 2 n=3 Tax=Pyricularia oryzae TaxID=318829 RepID=G4N3H1_PYRO7|nr:ubiquitin carboxyl-terminal hydrolase 2 [Pyricularia oryzae 70-15]EHA52646.1 ubiquitin carboxyl-terminal hydrolase 2 [Pyricularia oryzae 70-15]ELQ44634.1 ubiquitin carboxyl-terminal hydrolase 2 [Pyricularia oryzae Y34]KAI7930384.1 ubiquitin carboxyl-terminal hydrolase 2 [Pyricularia oryzae]KAI7932128.1 ubiquitin carboxyl-terminal hydrolase 2 [Pyricularia oryzae]